MRNVGLHLAEWNENYSNFAHFRLFLRILRR